MATFKQLEAFHWTVELDSLDAVASRLSTTPSTISKRLLELERSLGVALFDRSRRKVQVTSHGQALRALAAEALGVQARIFGLRSAAPGLRLLRLGVTELTAVTWFSNLVRRLRVSHPAVTLQPTVESSTSLADKLAAGALDMVVVPDAFRRPALAVVPLGIVDYAWLCSPGYLAEGNRLSLAALARHTIIDQSHGSGLGTLVETWSHGHGVRFDNTLASSSLTASASLTLAGMGICYLPRRIFEADIRSGRLRVIQSVPALPRVPYVALYRTTGANALLQQVAVIAAETCNFDRSVGGAP